MIRLNLFKSTEKLPEKVRGYLVRLENLSIEKKEDRRAYLQSIVRRLVRNGIDCAVKFSENSDIAVLSRERIEDVKKNLSKRGPREIETTFTHETIRAAWQNRVRAHLIRRGFMRVGDKFISRKDLTSESKFKRSFRIQSTVLNGFACLYIDPRTRIITPISEDLIEKAEELGEESTIRVRVLPNWTGGILVGRSGKKAKEEQFPLGSKYFPTPKYWKLKHEIDFVDPNDEMVEVYIPSFERTCLYPKSCVFLEFTPGERLPDHLKKPPDLRLSESLNFIKSIQPIKFLDKELDFELADIAIFNFKTKSFKSPYEFNVVVGGKRKTSINNVRKSLKKYGPYAGPVNGHYIVFYPSEVKLGVVKKAVSKIEKVYNELNLGKLKSATDDGFIEVGATATDYTSAIMELRPKMESNSKMISLIVLPSQYASEVYYKSRGKLFESIFGLAPIRTQALKVSTLEEMANEGRRWYPTAVNLASQIYVKLGGTGYAVWTLDQAADSAIKGLVPGSTCYAYHDVSRRPRMKASATAYSALTDSYGRFIATGTKPIGGEKLVPTTFHDILIELLQKVSVFSNKFRTSDHGRKFEFRRLVFAKDGVIKKDEEEMMLDVIINGVPDEGKEPLSEILKKVKILPNDLIIDIIGVNKSPNKRLFKFENGECKNVGEGTALAFDDKRGLLVSASSHAGTLQPIEITLHGHICLNSAELPEPHIFDILEEYYMLTNLDWASIFKQGKYALPQILTQKLGENVSAGINVPDNMILL